MASAWTVISGLLTSCLHFVCLHCVHYESEVRDGTHQVKSTLACMEQPVVCHSKFTIYIKTVTQNFTQTQEYPAFLPADCSPTARPPCAALTPRAGSLGHRHPGGFRKYPKADIYRRCLSSEGEEGRPPKDDSSTVRGKSG